MVRRFSLLAASVVLAISAAGYMLAAERATFILIDGERKSGTVVFHTPSRENLINGNLNLGTDNGREQTFPVDQVAVIDFVGGRPSPVEVQELPADNTNLLVLRSGDSQRGRLVNLVGGDTVRWQNEAGQQQQYAIRDVARIYLNPDRARTAMNLNGGAGTAVGTAGTAATALEPGAIRIAANQPWTNTGITVKKGDRVAFRATGQIAFGQSPGQTAGPDGSGDLKNPNYPVPIMPVGGLVGKVGNTAPFPIGSNTQPIVMPADGQLMLGVNDNELGDNGGFFSVVVTKQ
jgi:hypothetical protein